MKETTLQFYHSEVSKNRDTRRARDFRDGNNTDSATPQGASTSSFYFNGNYFKRKTRMRAEKTFVQNPHYKSTRQDLLLPMTRTEPQKKPRPQSQT